MLYILSFLVAILSVHWIHPRLVRIALDKNIVDNPNARKLQCRLTPILGGIAVFFGSVIGLGCASITCDCSELFIVVVAMMIMLYTGTMDDILDLSPALRFLIEIGTVLLLIFVGGYTLNDFHGLWGLNQIPQGVAIPLTVFAAVGIINAINLIDGVDGLSSGYCILTSLLFGVMFWYVGDRTMGMLAVVAAGSLIPFFFHNVFGKSSKMFIGDGGTLVMGIVMSVFVIRILRHGSMSEVYDAANIGLIPFTLAVLSVPVFDTLRVMTTRILKRKSPFHPDKTHLHHMFIRLGCSHAATTLAILILNFFVVLCWWISYMVGCSIDVQLYIVLVLSILITSGLYNFMEWHIRHKTQFVRLLHRIGYRTHLNRTGIFFWLQKKMDRI
ncbi:MAG: MraY family glycosyltransferase [Alistipes shahii]|uniref:MraY family glycosyltransferase n=1 Tax=Alistipes shahii TaxID=328814 RepID=UPI002108DB47|nr:MraY family glycosyltransferase [Alistipes shahii]MCQ5074427.1 undecaprenyl/decaprenyl-phosphate alpha-N-acetylglucosaminyl 1-phosphate transferase [Alistipes shahii]